MERTPVGRRRLNGWKEIAAEVGRGVRAAQRWERRFGMPVRRIGEGNGEIVYAFSDEIEAWQRSMESARREVGTGPARSEIDGRSAEDGAQTPRPSRGRISKGLAIAATLVVTLGLLTVATVAVWWWLGPARPASPATWRMEGNTFVVAAADGAELWRRPIPVEIDTSAYQPPFHNVRPNYPSVEIRDVDGDGRVEVLFVSRGLRASDQRLFCFNSDGTTRFIHRHVGGISFGGTAYPDNFGVFRSFVTRSSAGVPALWVVSRHNPSFPSVVERLAADGSVLSRYWSNGYVSYVAGGKQDGRDVLLVGAVTNETRQASLAVLDLANATGSAPATNAAYRCDNCPAGTPLRFYVFPTPERFRPLGRIPIVEGIAVEGNNRTFVRLAIAYAADGVQAAGSVYQLDAKLNPIDVEAGDQYMPVFRMLVRTGLLEGSADYNRRELWPMHVWAAGVFTPIEPAR